MSHPQSNPLPKQSSHAKLSKNDICRYRKQPHCCTRSVEAAIVAHVPAESPLIIFDSLVRMRDVTSSQFYNLQTFQLPFMSEGFRQAALQFKLIDNTNYKRSTLINEATVKFMDTFYNVDYMPKFCKEKIVQHMESSINQYLQELKFSYEMVETSWDLANDLFSLILSAEVPSSCLTNMIRSGLTTISCKTCTDRTQKIPTCFNYCREVVSSCLEPYKPVLHIVNQWFHLYVKVQEKIGKLVHVDRYLVLKQELVAVVNEQLRDEFYADVCVYHFNEDGTSDEYDTYLIPDDDRRKRIVKETESYSTDISVKPTTETSSEFFCRAG